MRLYTFCNMYLSSIQNGIQSAHLVHELFTKYDPNYTDTVDVVNKLYDWANNHKTIIVLNGGFQSELESIYSQLYKLCRDLQLPFTRFYEEENALNSALTCVGVIVPEEIYDMDIDAMMGMDGDVECSKCLPVSTEMQLHLLLKSKRLAN